jgi:hypothetical protein
MTKRNKKEQMSGKKQISEQVKSSECERALTEEELEAVVGGDLSVSGARLGYQAADNANATKRVKLDSTMYGLTHGNNADTWNHALQLNEQEIMKKNPG